MSASPSAERGNAEKLAPYRMWVATTTFRKDGMPVLGTMGSTHKRVVVIEVETFQRMLREHPTLKADTTIFELADLDG
jgi:hypothetical protein